MKYHELSEQNRMLKINFDCDGPYPATFALWYFNGITAIPKCIINR